MGYDHEIKIIHANLVLCLLKNITMKHKYVFEYISMNQNGP